MQSYQESGKGLEKKKKQTIHIFNKWRIYKIMREPHGSVRKRQHNRNTMTTSGWRFGIRGGFFPNGKEANGSQSGGDSAALAASCPGPGLALLTAVLEVEWNGKRTPIFLVFLYRSKNSTLQLLVPLRKYEFAGHLFSIS